MVDYFRGRAQDRPLGSPSPVDSRATEAESVNPPPVSGASAAMYVATIHRVPGSDPYVACLGSDLAALVSVIGTAVKFWIRRALKIDQFHSGVFLGLQDGNAEVLRGFAAYGGMTEDEISVIRGGVVTIRAFDTSYLEVTTEDPKIAEIIVQSWPETVFAEVPTRYSESAVHLGRDRLP